MKSGSFILYLLTFLSVVFNIILINIIINPSKINILVKLGIIKEVSNTNMSMLVMFILVFSIVTCILLLLSFILIIRKLLSYNKKLI